MALSHQFGKASLKSASEMASELSGKTPDKKSVERREVISPKAGSLQFIEKENVDNGTFAPSVSVELTGEVKQWGVRIDKALLDLVKRNSKRQKEDAEDMILLYAAKKGWK